MKNLFKIEECIHFLNHGSFGACSAEVFEVYQNWQHELECQPVEFLQRRYHDLMDEARAALSAYVNAPVETLVYVPNATVGINMVARSLKLNPGDEVLATDHEYGAIDSTWRFVCERSDAVYKQQPIHTPLTDDEAFIEQVWQGVTPRTRVIALSHITSPTALTFPVAAVCARARREGILTVIDGAHTPGQLALDLSAVGADFYTGNCHKWLCAPKGSGFLYVCPEHHAIIEPLVISWGWEEQTTFAMRNQWWGTRDIAAYLSVPAAIAFQQRHNWDAVRDRCHRLAVETWERLTALTGLPPLSDSAHFVQMFTVPVPVEDVMALKTRLYDEYNIEVPGIIWRDQSYLRISVQGYNTADDLDKLVEALGLLL